MTNVSKKFASVVETAQKRLLDDGFIMPVKTDTGIEIGTAKIISRANIKDVYNKGELMFSNISLNDVAIRLANMLAQKKDLWKMDPLYKADQEYGKWFTDCQVLMTSHRTAIKNQDFDRADMFFARYQESKARAIYARKMVETLLKG
jgi:hypothetical protein